MQRYGPLISHDARNICALEDALPVSSRDWIKISAAAARNRLPSRMTIDRQHAVVVKKTRQHRRRKFCHGILRARPYRRRHGEKIKLAKKLSKAVLIEEIAEFQLARVRA